nr:translation initiation factor IF-2 [Gorilla gorilla gorilla]
MSENAADRGRPQLGSPPRAGQSPGKPGPLAEVGGGADPTGLRRPGRRFPTPRSLLPPGWREERPLPVLGRALRLRRCPGRAEELLARPAPAGAMGEGRSWTTQSWVPGQAGGDGRGGSRHWQPASRSGRCALCAAAETAGTGPKRSRSLSGRLRRRRMGGATGSTTHSPGSSCGRDCPGAALAAVRACTPLGKVPGTVTRRAEPWAGGLEEKKSGSPGTHHHEQSGRRQEASKGMNTGTHETFGAEDLGLWDSFGRPVPHPHPHSVKRSTYDLGSSDQPA